MKLNEAVVFERPTAVVNDSGGREKGWEAVLDTRAHFRYLRGGEVVQAARLEGRQPTVVTIRRSDVAESITSDWRMIEKRRGDEYRIKAIIPSDDRLYMEVTCERVEMGAGPVIVGALGSLVAPRFDPFMVQYRLSPHSLVLVGGARTEVPYAPTEIVETSAPAEYASRAIFQGGRFQPFGNSNADQYELTYEMFVTPTIDGEVLAFDLDIGGQASIPIKPRTVALSVQAGDTQEITFSFDVYTAATFNANGAMLNVRSKSAATIGDISVKVDVDVLG